MKKHYLLQALALSFFITLVSNFNLSGQCEDPILIGNDPTFDVYLDLSTNPSTLVFEGASCNPCQFMVLPNYNSNMISICKCHAFCEVAQTELQCKDNCGELPESAPIESWVLQVQFWWTTNLVEQGIGTTPDQVFNIGNNQGEPPPKSLWTNTTTNLSPYYGQISWCIFYELRINNADGSCCYFVGYECIQRG